MSKRAQSWEQKFKTKNGAGDNGERSGSNKRMEREVKQVKSEKKWKKFKRTHNRLKTTKSTCGNEKEVAGKIKWKTASKRQMENGKEERITYGRRGSYVNTNSTDLDRCSLKPSWRLQPQLKPCSRLKYRLKDWFWNCLLLTPGSSG